MGAAAAAILALSMTALCYAQEADDTRPSCAGRCGEAYFPNKPCYCNEACVQFENCCVDYLRLCNPDAIIADEWHDHAGHSYRFYEDNLATAVSAAQRCAEEGALLASLNSREEADFVARTVLRMSVMSVFIGGTDADSEGRWRWADGQPMPGPGTPASLWYPGQPDDGASGGSGEHCSLFTRYKFWASPKVSLSSFYWADHACGVNAKDVQGFLCERTLQCDSSPCQNNATCRYAPSESRDHTEFVCDCRPNFYGARCQTELKPGEAWTECGSTSLSGPSGQLTSPLYPLEYPPRTDCSWTIRVEDGHTVALRINNLELEAGKNCAFDSLTLYDGRTSREPVLLGPMCGSRQFTKDIFSSTNEVTLKFKSDDTVNLGGFDISYKENECSRGLGDSGCGTVGRFNSSCGRIQVRQGSVRPEGACEWVIDVPPGAIVNLTFNEFSIQDTGMGCGGGALAVYDGPNASARLLGRYCGLQFPWSLHSSSSSLYLRLEDIEWESNIHVISMEYNSLDETQWRRTGLVVDARGRDGTLTTEGTDPTIETDHTSSYKWVVKVTPGSKVNLTWMVTSELNTTLKIYDGSREDCHLAVDTSHAHYRPSEEGHFRSTTFSLLIVATKVKDDDSFRFTASYTEEEWLPEMSGCYRPAYSALTSRPETENTLVTPLEPVVLSVSDHRLEDQQPVYPGGMYCKWRIRGEAGSRLSLRLLSLNVQPQDAECSVDGLVIYSGSSTQGTKYGPLCGSKDSLTSTTIDLPTSDMVVVFYSSTVSRHREGGVLRALVTAQDNDSDSCRTDQLGETKSKLVKSSCGILLSPNFPGSVPPEVWTWFIETPLGAEGGHLEVYVYYVRGPAVQSTKCSEYFKLFEVPKDSSTLRHYETQLLKLCEDTDLFIPEKKILLPPYQKLGVELSTATSALYQRWQFKLAYKTEQMVPPKQTKSSTEKCPSGHYYRGHCYKLYQWALRHYESNEGRYDFAKTWQRSLDHCHSENGTLLTIKDEEEAYYIKYMLSHDWFWDPIGTFQTNHRLIFLGLHNRDSDYKWTDGTSLAYSDWYWPQPALYTPPVYPDTDPATTDLLHTNLPQPTADSGSLCTVLLPLSPHGPLNWAKVPCDYPFSRTSAICKSPAVRITAGEGENEDTQNVTQDLLKRQREDASPTNKPRDIAALGYTACPSGWLSTRGHCLMMHTNYADLSNLTQGDHTGGDLLPLTYPEARQVCRSAGGEVMTFDPDMLSTLRELLRAWGHSEVMGGVWMGRDGQTCSAIQVSRGHRLEITPDFTPTTTDCDHPDRPVYSVLCQTSTIVRREVCRRDEFTCHNQVCVSVDSVCDGTNDCFDGSDEINCECGADYFRCADGDGCVPVSLFCDFIPHCNDKSDELNCVVDKCTAGQFTCDNGECIDQTKVCDFVVDCSDRSDEVPDTCVGQCRGFQCYSGQCLRGDLQEDLVADCAGLQREEEVDRENGQSGVLSIVSEGQMLADNHTQDGVMSCSDPLQVACREGEPRCYPRAALCVYDTAVVDPINDLSVMTSCRNGHHLRTNCDVADCPGMFRCPDSYCVPFTKVCDGTRDCPRGHDEASCHNYTCPGMLHCKGESFCVPHDKVCDGEVNCPLHGEDEKYCGLKDVTCVDGCNCTGNVVTCTDVGLTSLPEPDVTSAVTRSLRALLLSGNRLTLTSRTLVRLHWLGRLDLSRNQLQELPVAMFSDLKNLFELDLSFNMIHTLDGQVFTALVSLRVLNLHGNQLTTLRIDTLGSLTSLSHLILTGNKLSDVSQDAFDGLQALDTINTDAYKFCCIAKHVKNCTPEPDEFSSCEDLMSNSALQVSIWVLGVLALVGNLFVMIWRVNTDRTRISSFFIINLGCSDLLMGVYLLIIASVDVFYRGRYILHADAWRSSGLCKAAGVVAMVSSEVSVFMLTAITADRFVNFVFPLRANKFRLAHARSVAVVGWVVCICISVVPALGLPYFGDAFFGRTGVCLPFHLSDERLPGWEYSVFIFLVLNFVSFVAIFIGYVTIFFVVSRSSRAVQSTSSLDEYSLAKKLALIVGTDLACWVPIILIGFAALAGAQVPPQVAAWVAVFVLPLNSAVNPLLYTVSAIDFSRIFRRKTPKNVSIGQTSVSMVSTKN